MTTLLPFHTSILERISDPKSNDLLVLARGLGLRRIICTLLKIYDTPTNLILLLNASPEEAHGIGEQLGLMGCRKPGLRIIGYEMGKKERGDLYKGGGLCSVTSRILVVDMLQSDIPVDLITGIVVLQAEKVTALSLEAFIVRLYRERNTTGFLKAFTDQPEYITSGLSPLKSIMKELQLRTVHIYPRFHEEVKSSLERRRADVIELYQGMSELMTEIHGAIVQCMNATLSELRRSNANLDLDDINVSNAYFRSFDSIVRRQLDPVWHKVGPRTKGLVRDLGELRRILGYLITYDSLSFHAYLETIIASNSSSGPIDKKERSPWLMSDAADIIFRGAKRRCYISVEPSKGKPAKEVIDLVDDEDAWEALDEIQGGNGNKGKGKDKEKEKDERPYWLPSTIEPTLEELPKWCLLAEVLKEIEGETLRIESLGSKQKNPGSDTVLIMASSTRTGELIREFLATHDPEAPKGTQGRNLMEDKLKLYLWWKKKLVSAKEDGRPGFGMPKGSGGAGKGDGDVSEAMRRKDERSLKERGSRRRVRGGAPTANVVGEKRNMTVEKGLMSGEGEMRNEASDIAEFLYQNPSSLPSLLDAPLIDFEDESCYGLIPSSQTVIVRAYSDDTDDLILSEIQPRFVIMFEPNQDFVRRVEVYRSSNPGLGVRVYFMVYQVSCEEHKYLAGIRREKESFERLIKERGSMLLPIFEDRSAATGGAGDAIIKTISSRIAGGRKELNKEPSRVIVDMREFRSTLPSLLHASKLLVIPATLTVGDYIVTPDICVERKSIPDLMQSFNSGRLYTQCELMSVHYKQPVLLIEFEEHKSFSLETFSEIKSYAKASSKYPSKKSNNGPDDRQIPTIQHKLVLLCLTFPRIRIIWSSSPYATAEIFNDLKHNNPEPDSSEAIAVGADEDPDAGAGVNTAAEELLRCLPGITAKNVKHVMSKVRSVREFCEMDKDGVEDILGVEPGKACWEFMHRGERTN